METVSIFALALVVGLLCGLGLAAQNLRSYRGAAR
jgi:hypothetical protein